VKQSKSVIHRPRTVTILGFSLILQGLGLICLAGIHIYRSDVVSSFSWHEIVKNIPVILKSTGFFALGFLGLLASIGFFRLWKYAWLSAMLLQGLCMTLALDLYFIEKPFYVYILMIYCILMVIYLNYSEIILAFRTKYPMEI
jgi:hypothetical protein